MRDDSQEIRFASAFPRLLLAEKTLTGWQNAQDNDIENIMHF